MFRMARLIILIGLGFYLGYKFKETQMSSLCAAGDGTWTGTICLDSELVN